MASQSFCIQAVPFLVGLIAASVCSIPVDTVIKKLQLIIAQATPISRSTTCLFERRENIVCNFKIIKAFAISVKNRNSVLLSSGAVGREPILVKLIRMTELYQVIHVTG